MRISRRALDRGVVPMADPQKYRKAKEAAAREGRFLGWAGLAALLYLVAMAAAKFWS